MVTKQFTILNEKGFHARPAGMLAKAVKTSESQVHMKVKEKVVDCRSIVTLMTTAVRQGEEVEIQVDGQDETRLIQEIEAMFLDGFGE
ncbi:HPr family phosphocarrier protein [Gottschalkiaceae bacterium SANA]|nr:HPr family phosphocarrier protein [Gottschalkiaceae bacterium SANA]